MVEQSWVICDNLRAMHWLIFAGPSSLVYKSQELHWLYIQLLLLKSCIYFYVKLDLVTSNLMIFLSCTFILSLISTILLGKVNREVFKNMCHGAKPRSPTSTNFCILTLVSAVAFFTSLQRDQHNFNNYDINPLLSTHQSSSSLVLKLKNTNYVFTKPVESIIHKKYKKLHLHKTAKH